MAIFAVFHSLYLPGRFLESLTLSTLCLQLLLLHPPRGVQIITEIVMLHQMVLAHLI